MSLLLVDGFELYPVSTDTGVDFGRIWSGQYVDGGVGGARSGSKCARFNVQTKRLVRYLVGAEQVATVIVGMGIYKLDTNDCNCMVFMADNHTTVHVTITINANGSIRANRGPSTGTLLGTSAATGLIPTATWKYLEVKVTLSATVGVVAVNVDGVNVLNLTGQNTKNGGTATVFDDIEIGWIAISGGCLLDDVYEATGDATPPNDFIGPCVVRTLWPNGNGANSAGAGSDGNSVNNFQLVQDGVPSTGTATYVDLANTNDEDTYTFDDLIESSGTVAAVQTTTYAQKMAADTRTLDHVTRIGGTDYPTADMALPTSFGWQVTRQVVSPATAVAFTRAEVNGAEFGARAK
jgi:hypothetical protein